MDRVVPLKNVLIAGLLYRHFVLLVHVQGLQRYQQQAASRHLQTGALLLTTHSFSKVQNNCLLIVFFREKFVFEPFIKMNAS